MARVPEYAGATMAAYAVIARIGRVDPHLTLHDLDRIVDGDEEDDGGLPMDPRRLAVEVVTIDEHDRLAEWWSRAREIWKQTTFYVFDADSWRT